MTSIEYIKSIPEFMFGGSFSLKRRGLISRQYKDFDVIVPKSFWGEFKESSVFPLASTSRYPIAPEGIFIWSICFNDYNVDLIFRDDYSSCKYELVNGYKHMSVEEIIKQKKHLLDNWTGNEISKHRRDIQEIEQNLNTLFKN